MKKILILILAGALVAGVAVYFVYNKPHRDVANEKPAFTVTADQLFDEYEADENAANAKYLDATIEVTGTVIETGTNDAGQPFAVLEASNAMIGGIHSTFKTTFSSEDLQEGKEVCVKGRCTGKLMDVVITDATLKKTP
ncbi:MAG: hypothetical protein GC178_15270 [Flavobacteriales bacterium]|nr:hypothetical protein [Flavobacteriales bacterium]